MTVSARFSFFGGGTLVVPIVLSRRAWSRCRTTCWLSKSSSSLSDDKVDSRRSSRSFSLISRSVSVSSCFIRLIARTLHQRKTFPSGRNGSVKVDALRQSHQRHHGGGLLSARRQYRASRCISPSDRCFAISSRSFGLQFQTNTLALLPTVTIRQNGFIGYMLASGSQCNG